MKSNSVTIEVDIQRIIEFIKRTDDDKWCTDVVKTQDGKSCIMGHIFDMGGNMLWELFESVFATTYMIYPVNDGTHPTYKQTTPKERILAYLSDLRDGKASTTQDIEEDYDAQRIVETWPSLGPVVNKQHIIK